MDKASYIPLVIGLVSLCSPFVYLSVIPRLKQMDPQLYEAALDLGCSPIWSLKKGCIATVNFRNRFWIYDVDHINIR